MLVAPNLRKILIIGATGQAGSGMVKEALSRGIQVKAFSRNLSKLPDDVKDRVEGVAGDVQNYDDILKAVKGVDAVIYAISPRSLDDDTKYMARGLQNVLKAMKAEGVEVINVLISVFSIMPIQEVPEMFRIEMNDQHAMHEALVNSDLKYIASYPPSFVRKPSAWSDENHPDWVPSQHMGHQSQVHSKRKSDVDRKLRADKRTKLNKEEWEPRDLCNDECVHRDEEQACQGIEEGCATQTDLTMSMLATKLEQLEFASKKLVDLEKKVENTPLGLMDNIDDTHKWKYYTGFDYEFIKIVIFPEIEPHVTSTSTTILTPFNQLLLTLVKLRLNLHFKDLAFRFKVSATTASSYFQNMIHIMYRCLKVLIIWPDRPESLFNIPSCFKEAFQDKTTIIIDCFEVFTEKPENYLTQQQCWSTYKHHNTIKFLIGITPQGTISYISKGWGGRASDKQMVELGNFCNYIKPGDVVLADRGFVIEETLGIFGAKLVIPAFTKGKSQLHPLEIEATRHIANVRIHVERIIGVIKNKFRIFKGPLPISMLKVGNDKICILDKIVTVCSALINILPPIVPQ